MQKGITVVTLPLPYRLGSVNCHLIETEQGHILIDTGASNKRTDLERALESAGCRPGDLKLILLTHGDFDHIGNAAHLRRRFGAKIAMHYDDSGMAEHGDMFWNRKTGGTHFRVIAPILFRFAKSDRFTPDVYVDEGYDLCQYGFDAQVVRIPGHSKGSIGIITAGRDLFCGDLFENRGEPGLNPIMDDSVAANASVEKLRSLEIDTVYPGHGKPFPMEESMAGH